MLSDKYIANRFQSIKSNGSLLIFLPQSQISINSGVSLMDVLSKLNTPHTKSEILEFIDVKLFNFLDRTHLIVKEDLYDLYSGEILKKEHLFSTLDRLCLREKEDKKCYTLLGLPFDLVETRTFDRSQGAGNVRKGLKHLTNSLKQLEEAGIGTVYDYELKRKYNITKDYFYDLGEIILPKSDSHVHSLSSIIDRVINFLYSNNVRPIFFGADHSITYHCIKSMSQLYENITLIHFDAHSDLYISPFDPDDELNHANVCRKILEEIDNVDILQLGVREFFFSSSLIREKKSEKIETYSSIEVLQSTAPKLLSKINKQNPVYLTFDADVLDPSFCPDTGSPVPGGITYFKALEFIDYISNTFDLIGADFVELGSQRDSNSGFQIITNLIMRIVLNSCDFVDETFDYSFGVMKE